jgi:hypothetical protein
MDYITEKILELSNRLEVAMERKKAMFAQAQEAHLKWVQASNLYGEDSDTAEEYLEWYEQAHKEWFDLDDKTEKMEQAIIALGKAQKALGEL